MSEPSEQKFLVYVEHSDHDGLDEYPVCKDGENYYEGDEVTPLTAAEMMQATTQLNFGTLQRKCRSTRYVVKGLPGSGISEPT